MMYQIQNGILTRDNEKIFAIGESYYPSFHPAKYPVPPEGDRIGEMKKDFWLMHKMGINHLRFAAIGLTKLNEDGRLVIDTPFVNAMIEEADKNEISVSVRLEGYVVNLRGFRNVLMIDADGNEQDTRIWYDFIQSTLHHDGLREDNALHARSMAAYYAKFPNMVAYQIYNEPHYPGGKFFDYHPLAIADYRKWLVEKGMMTEGEASSYQPPRTRKEQSPEMWAWWRIFCRDSLTRYLNETSAAAKQGADLPTFTCYTSCQSTLTNVFRGVDQFNSAKEMDIVGYTCYIHAEGSDFYAMNMAADMVVSAAKLHGKESWCIELDSRTSIPPRIFNKNTYVTVGAGVKGIVYYQWRGDYPSEATPIPNGCGLVNYDGSRTANYDNAAAMIALLNRLSPQIVNSNPVNDGIGILHSDYAAFYCDALENNDECTMGQTDRNTCMANLYTVYTDIRKAGLSAVFLTAEDLEENVFEIRYLFIPKEDALSAPEKMAVERFIRNGGVVYGARTKGTDRAYEWGYALYGVQIRTYEPYWTFGDLAYMNGWQPRVQVDLANVAVQVLAGDGYQLIVLSNISHVIERCSPVLTCGFDFTEAVLYTNHGEPVSLKSDGRTICVDDMTDGGIIVIK